MARLERRRGFHADHRSFGAFLMDPAASPAISEARSAALKIALTANARAGALSALGKAESASEGHKPDGSSLAGSYRFRRAIWTAGGAYKNPRQAYEVYSNAQSAGFNEFGGGRNKTSPKPRRILRRAAASVAAARLGGAG